MELKVFRDILYAGGGCCTVKAEIPVETEILISDYLPQVFKIVKCFARPVVLQKQLQPGKLSLEGYIRCTVYLSGGGRGGAVPDRTEDPLQQSAGPAGVCLLLLERGGGGGDRVHQLPGGEPPADRGAGGLWAGGVGEHPVQHRGHHRPGRLRHPAAPGHPPGGEAGRRP